MKGTSGIELKYICNPQASVPCPTLDELVASSSSDEVVTAIDLANKEDAVFTGITPLVLNQTIEDSLSLNQHNALNRVSLQKQGETPVIYGANDFGSNNAGAGASFLTLTTLNPNGNLNRFELLGTGVVIDWKYRLYWTKSIQGFARWATHNSISLALTLEGLTGWRLPSRVELLVLTDCYLGDPLNYAPFNHVLSNQTVGGRCVCL